MVIEPTRALVAVDINTGPDTSPAAGLKANIAAIRALPRELRLRGLGGQVVIDSCPLFETRKAGSGTGSDCCVQTRRARYGAGGLHTLGQFRTDAQTRPCGAVRCCCHELPDLPQIRGARVSPFLFASLCDVDLARWLRADYAIPVPLTDAEDDTPDGDAGQPPESQYVFFELPLDSETRLT